MECGNCKVIVTKDKIDCSGFCQRSYHYSCVAVNRVTYTQCLKCPNIKWFCDECSNLIDNNIFKKCFTNINSSFFKELDFKLSLINEEVVHNRGLIENLVAKLPETKTLSSEAMVRTASLSLMPSSSTESQKSPSPLLAVPIMTNIAAEKSISISSASSSNDAVGASTSILGSSGTSVDVVKFDSHTAMLASKTSASTRPELPSCEPDISADTLTSKDKYLHRPYIKTIYGVNSRVNVGIITVAPTFWIHLSKFDPKTSDADILDLVKVCLSISSCKVRRLVPKNRKLEDLEYVCFKVGITEELHAKALDPDTWPTGISIKIFSNFRTSRLPRVKFRTSDPVVDTVLT